MAPSLRQEKTVISTGSDLSQAPGSEPSRGGPDDDPGAGLPADQPSPARAGNDPGSIVAGDLSQVLVTEREHWLDGPPHGLFADLRARCPVHWTSHISEYPEEAGYWSVTRAEDVHTVSRDWRTYSSELGGVTAMTD